MCIRDSKWAKDLNCPVLVHVHTKKGKGYPPAEREPERYHGVGKFDPRMGCLLYTSDVVGDICGIVSGSTATVIVVLLQNSFGWRSIVVSTVVTARCV